MKFSKESVIKQITGSAKANKECADKLGFSIQTIYNWPNQIGAQRMKEIIRRMEEKKIPVPASWKRSQKAH
jgi:transposase